jgi:succinate dehydrogenase/fumarate reductase flavoprotein subunit/uncharacterized protein with FMN-binding domain
MTKTNKREKSGISRRDFLVGATAVGALSAFSLSGCGPNSNSVKDNEASAGETRVVTGSGTGRIGDIVCKMTLVGTTVTAIDIIKQEESELIAHSAFSRIPELVIKNQSLDVDAVAGATITSFGIKMAIEDALSKAGLTADDLARTGKDSGHLIEDPIEADIAIIGGGLAGLVCAVRLLQKGKKAVIFEESAHLGGSAVCASGWLTGAGTLAEDENGVKDSPATFYQHMVDITEKYHGVIEFPDVAHAYAEKTGEVFNWLDTYVNVDFGERVAMPGVYDTPDLNRIFRVNRGGSHLVNPLIDFVGKGIAEEKLSVILEARVTKINTDSSGAVTGVEITYADGTIKNFEYSAVILCTGGYGGSAEMMQQYNFTNCCTDSPSTSRGHGYDIAQEVGAQLVYMEGMGTYGGGLARNGGEMRHKANVDYPGQIWVTLEGVRKASEDEMVNTSVMWSEALDNIGFSLFSEAQKVAHLRPILKAEYHKGDITPWESWELLDQFAAEGEYVFIADTVEELAQKTGIDATNLARTIETYNGYCEAGADPEFGRVKNLKKLEGRLYAIKGIPFSHMTSGGIRINPQSEVLDKDEKPIPNLYAAGEQLGTRQYAGYVRSGCGLGGAATWGYIAADVVGSRK